MQAETDIRSDWQKRYDGITAYFEGYASVWNKPVTKVIAKKTITAIADKNPSSEFDLLDTGIKVGMAAQHADAILKICKESNSPALA